MKYKLPYFFLLVFVSAFRSVYCQVDRGGNPRSFHSQFVGKSEIQEITITPPDMFSIQKEDLEDARWEKSYRVGVEIPVNLSTSNCGRWDDLPQGGRIWRAAIQCVGSQATGLNFSEIQLPDGSDMFVYSPDHAITIGAITTKELNKGKAFAIRPIAGEHLVIEYYEPSGVAEHAVINISGITYIYRGFGSGQIKSARSDLSGSCEVNVNCEEGLNWQKQKQGVVKILTKVASNLFYCSGSLINNTNQDFSSLLLTASHCSKGSGSSSTVGDLAQWIFYFNYETTGCTNSGAQELTMVGAEKLADSDDPSDMGSDFLLLKLLSNIPPKYNPFYCGWDKSGGFSTSGVSIHHPNGDVKKISTFTTQLGSGTWGTTPNTHWIVHWSATTNGYGVTEGGSSGAPLFDNEGLVIGSLTGGPSGCDNTSGEDMYGKISYSWESNGITAQKQLKPWLDPGNTGTLKLPGSFNEKLTAAGFSSSNAVIPFGGTVNFQDLSTGKPDTWHWYFQRGVPSESKEQNPSGIRFDYTGKWNVQLVVSNSYNSDSIVKEGYIDVRSVVSPNPCNGIVNILSDSNNESDFIIDVFDLQGRIAQHFEFPGAMSPVYAIKLPDMGNLFIIRVLHGDQQQTHKIRVIR